MFYAYEHLYSSCTSGSRKLKYKQFKQTKVQTMYSKQKG